VQRFLLRILCGLLFLAWTAEAPNDYVLYSGLWRSPFEVFSPLFATLPGVNLFAWQLMFLALAPLCLLRPGAFRRRALSLDGAILVSFLSVVVTFLWGWMRGGDAYNAYYQLWRFLLALLAALLLSSVIRSRRDLRLIGLTVLAAALTRGTLVIYFYWAIVRGRGLAPPPAYMTTHDDSLLFMAGLISSLAFAAVRQRLGAWLAAGTVWLHLLYAVVLNGRRLAWIELMMSLTVLYILLPRGAMRRRVNRLALLVAPLLLVYVAVGWGRQGALFEPLRALGTSGSDEDASSLARLEEIRNLMYTLSAAGNPLLGTGWGVPYQQVTTIYTQFGSGWSQYRFMPHNSLIGVAVFAGVVGIFGIWLVVPVTAFLGALGARRATRPLERAAAMAAVSILPAYGAQCYGDIGFQSFTGGLLLGVAMAVAARVSVWAQAAGTVPPGAPR
jgi:hypothetical protein